MPDEELTEWKAKVESRLKRDEKLIENAENVLSAILSAVSQIKPRKWYDSFSYGSLTTIIVFILLGLFLSNGS